MGEWGWRWGLDGVRTSGSARVGAGSTCINLSEERYKHREWLTSDGGQEENTFLFKAHKYFQSILSIHILYNLHINTYSGSHTL